MAIEKEIITSTGLKTKYHKIKKVELDLLENKTLIYIDSYTDSKYRDKEKNNENLGLSIANLIDKYNNETREEIKNTLYEKVLELDKSNNYIKDLNLIVNEEVIKLDYVIEDTSLSNIYEILSNLDSYKDSKEV